MVSVSVNFIQHIPTQDTNNYTIDVNTSAVLGAIPTDTGYSLMNENMAFLSVLPMTNDQYSKECDLLSAKLQDEALKSMEKAVKEEAEFATQGHIDANGIPYRYLSYC